MRILYKPHGLKLFRRVVRVKKYWYGSDPAGQAVMVVEKINGNKVKIPVAGCVFDEVLSILDKRPWRKKKAKTLADFRGIDGKTS